MWSQPPQTFGVAFEVRFEYCHLQPVAIVESRWEEREQRRRATDRRDGIEILERHSLRSLLIGGVGEIDRGVARHII